MTTVATLLFMISFYGITSSVKYVTRAYITLEPVEGVFLVPLLWVILFEVLTQFFTPYDYDNKNARNKIATVLKTMWIRCLFLITTCAVVVCIPPLGIVHVIEYLIPPPENIKMYSYIILGETLLFFIFYFSGHLFIFSKITSWFNHIQPRTQ